MQTPHKPHNYIKRVGYARDANERSHLLHRLVNASGYQHYPAQFSQSELVAFTGWPMGDPNVYNLPQSKARFLPVASSVSRGENRGDIVLADSNVPGRERPVAISLTGASMHTYLSAPSGRGKSVTLGNAFRQIVSSPLKMGAMIIETKGESNDLFHKALNYIPPERVDDVIIVDVRDPLFPVALNILHQGNPATVAANMQSLFDAVFKTGSLTFPEALYFGCMLLMTTKAAPTPLAFTDLSWLFKPRTRADMELGRKLAEGVPDYEIQEWWEDMYRRYPDPDKFTAQFAPLRRRIWQITGRSELRNIFGQSESSFSMFDAIRQGKIVLANIAGLGDDVKNLIGAILVDLVWGSIKAGAASMTRPFHLMLDEFQNYPNVARDADIMLSEGRAFGLDLWLANQGVTQLSTKTANAIMVNASNKIVMQTDGANAATFAKELGRGITEDDLKNLEGRTAACRFMGSAGLSPVFTATMRPPLPDFGLAAEVRKRSRDRYGRDVKMVEKEIRARRTVEVAAESKKMPPLGRLG